MSQEIATLLRDAILGPEDFKTGAFNRSATLPSATEERLVDPPAAAAYGSGDRSSGRVPHGLAAEEALDICGELCRVLEEEAVCGVWVDLDFGLGPTQP